MYKYKRCVFVNKVVLITKLDKVELLEELGFCACGSRDLYGQTAYQFVVTDKLYRVLNDKAKFNKKDYVYDTRLVF
jgi:hypothetical protein